MQQNAYYISRRRLVELTKQEANGLDRNAVRRALKMLGLGHLRISQVRFYFELSGTKIKQSEGWKLHIFYGGQNADPLGVGHGHAIALINREGEALLILMHRLPKKVRSLKLQN